MKKLILTNIILSILFLIFNFSSTIAQNTVSDSAKNDKEPIDSSKGWTFAWNWSPKDFNLTLSEMPTLEFQWGFDKASIYSDYFKPKFANTNSGELHIGHTTKKSRFNSPEIFKYEFHYVFIGNTSSDLASVNSNTTDIKSNIWKFGIADNTGYGYSLGKSSELILYTGGGLMWSHLDFKNKQVIPLDDPLSLNTLDTYGDVIRFGKTWEGGIKYQIVAPLSITVGFEGMQIFPRHIFWEWIGSEVVENIGQGMLSEFSKEVIKSSAIAGPIVHFVLKNALSYGLYELRKKNMNWPFKTAAPLSIENYKIGLSMAF